MIGTNSFQGGDLEGNLFSSLFTPFFEYKYKYLTSFKISLPRFRLTYNRDEMSLCCKCGRPFKVGRTYHSINCSKSKHEIYLTCHNARNGYSKPESIQQVSFFSLDGDQGSGH